MLKPGMYISDRYEIIDKVGSGGMADVYKARCHRLNRFIAIKVLKNEYSDDKNFVKKFRGEAQSAAGLSHPNIVNVYDVGDDNGLHYIVMELVEGITLKNFIDRKGKLDVKEAIGISIQIALGMEAAHTNHIIHRDIKPQNIIISKEGKVKVTDFGIAKATNSNTITSNAMGSVHYLSPEQARGGYSDEKSDIYSLGVTLYEMLTGKVPFVGDNTVSVALLHIQGEAMPLREIDPTIPLSIERIVQKCMQKKPERRYLSASELITDLKRSISNPNGDFVVIPAAAMVSDSPTINISQAEVNTINNAAKLGAGAAIVGNGMNGQGAYKNNKPSNTGKLNNTGKLYNTGKFSNTGKLSNDKDKLDVRAKGNELNNLYEDEELDSVDPRVEKLLLIGTIAAGIILTLIILFFVSKTFRLFDKKDDNNDLPPAVVTEAPTPTPEVIEEIKNIIVPSVVGLTLEDAKLTIEGKSKHVNVSYTEEYSDTHEKGLVSYQYPKPGAEIPGDAEITLIISTGPEPMEIPNVYNLTEGKAIEELEKLGFVVSSTKEFSDEIEEGRVISTVPERLTTAFKGETINLVISSGREITEVEVPDLLDLSQDEALNELEASGLKRGSIRNDYSDKYDVGSVMEQSHKGGTMVPKGTSIDITISLGSGIITNPVEPDDEQGEGDEQGQVGVVTHYTSKFTISDNPFSYPGEKGYIIVELEQDGKTSRLLRAEKSYEEFPIVLSSIVSASNSTGTIRMYVGRVVDTYSEGVVSENGFLIKYEPHDTSWAINFSPVSS